MTELLESRQLLSVITVDISGDTTQPGHTTLRDAIATANADGSGDTITFDSGLAGQTITLTQGQLETTGSMTITGLGANQLTIDGNNTSRIFRISSSNQALQTVTITGLTLQGGNGDGNGVKIGGAIFNRENLTLADDVITRNSSGFGGGIWNESGAEITLTHDLISGNSASSYGGAVENQGSITSTYDAFTSNSGIFGGAILNESSASRFTSMNDTISNNTATYGAGIYSDGSFTASHDLISENSAQGSSNSSGGGIDIGGGTFSSTDDTIFQNDAPYGAGIYESNASLITSHDLISENSANGTSNSSGGGIYFYSGTLLSTDDTISKNTAFFGGGIYESNGSLITSHDLISENSVQGSSNSSGGGIYVGGGTFSSTDDTISKNTATYGAGIYQRNASSITSNDLISGNSAIGASDSQGGGIFNNGTFNSNHDTITGNSADSGGGGGVCNFDSFSASNDAITGNSTTNGIYGGGGVLNSGAFVSLGDLISGNLATYGGGINNDFDSATFTSTNDTLTGNASTHNGGAILNAFGTFTTTNDTISGNTSSGTNPVDVGGIFTTDTAVSFNILNTIVVGNFGPAGSDVSGTFSASSANNLTSIPAGMTLANVLQIAAGSSPLQPQLKNNGGPTQTISLAPSSLAIGIGGALAHVTGSGDGGTTLTLDRTTYIAVGDELRIGTEIVDVTAVPSSTTILVQRAQAGTSQISLNGLPMTLAFDQRGFVRPTSAVNNIGASSEIPSDLKLDWSDAGNPNGLWSYSVGGTPLQHFDDVSGTYGFSSPQPGYGNTYAGAWIQNLGSYAVAPADVQAGDVIAYADEQGQGGTTVTWTSPGSEVVNIFGNLWPVNSLGRSTHWALYFNGQLLSSGDLSDQDLSTQYSRRHPFDLATGSGGAAVLQHLSVSTGDTISLVLAKAAQSSSGDFVGVNLSVAGNLPVNQAPQGTSNTISTLEDTNYVFHAADFGFTDPNNFPANNLAAVVITTVPTTGILTDNGLAVTAGQSISIADINGGNLIFAPAAHVFGVNCANFTFQVQDDGGTADGGVDTDRNAKSLEIDVTYVNHAPSGATTTLAMFEDTGHAFQPADFGFTDPDNLPADKLSAVEITTLPTAGFLTDNGIAVSAGQFIPVADITGSKLIFTPAAHVFGTNYGNFTFQVQDNGGTSNGGVDTDPIAKLIEIDVTFVNHAPTGTSTTVTTSEDTNYAFTTADFGFSDANNIPANALAAVKIATLPTAGTLSDNGTAVTVGQSIPVADLTSGQLIFTPASNANGSGYSAFTFQVQDDGGTPIFGVDTDPNPKTLTVDVTSVNDAPVGVSNSVTVMEDSTYIFQTGDFGFSDSNDSPSNSLLAVEITSLPAVGILRDNGSAVTAGQFVSATDVTNNKLVFTPAANANGTGYASFTFQVQDNGGVSNGGVDTDSIPKTLTINVTSVNDAPVGKTGTVTTLEDSAYALKTTDFGFTDPNDNPVNTLLAVKIATLPTKGTFTNNGVAVAVGQFVSAADITNNRLVFTPAANANGTGYASFTFQVQDNGGVSNGGLDTDSTPKTLTINVTSVNDAPVGKTGTVTTQEDTAYALKITDFGFTDSSDNPANTLLAVKIATLPTKGTFTDNGVAVTAGQFVSAADIINNRLVFTPAVNANGTGYASFTFQVQDNGGVSNGGLDTDSTPKTLTINVTSVNDGPVGKTGTVTTLEDTSYTLKTTDFGLTDSSDNPGNTLLAVKIATLPTKGTFTDNGVAVAAGQFVSAADIINNRLVFTPAVNANGTGYASFTFQVQDNGGILNGGLDTDSTPKTLTINVTSVNDAPAGKTGAVTTLEDTSYTLKTTDFGHTDSSDNPANTLLAVRIATLPTKGTLTDNGVAVAAGQFVSAADITNNRLVFTPAANANGTGYASFTFQVQDNGGVSNGGLDTDSTPKTLNINVSSVNDAPMGKTGTVTTLEDTAYKLKITDFGLTDASDNPANTLLAVKIATLPTKGTLTDNGVAVTAGQFVSAADITNNRLVFTPAANANGTGYASFTFQVQDNGGVSNGGLDTDSIPKTLTINVTSVNDAPVGKTGTVTTLEDTAYKLKTLDFGFADLNDNPPNTLFAVKFTMLPTATVGALTDNGIAVTLGQLVSTTDISIGKLVFTPKGNLNGGPFFFCKFQVEDNGGTANAGVNLDPVAKVLYVRLTSVNDAPVGAAHTATMLKNTVYTFTTTDFAFTDSSDTPPNTFLSVKIATLPLLGKLTDNGVAVVVGAHISVADITAGKLKFTPATNGTGIAYTSFTFQVQDNGGTLNGGIDTDLIAKKMTFSVT